MSTSETNKALGTNYKDELYKGFDTFMNFSFTFTSVSVIACISTSFSVMISTGGPSVTIWGWIIASFFTILISFAMGELSSTMPTAGSVYHWAAMLAPRRYSALSAYICGIFNFVGNVAGDAAFAFGFSSVVATASYYSKLDEFGAPIGKEMSTGEQVAQALAFALFGP
jgi:amino acid transporter